MCTSTFVSLLQRAPSLYYCHPTHVHVQYTYSTRTVHVHVSRSRTRTRTRTSISPAATMMVHGACNVSSPKCASIQLPIPVREITFKVNALLSRYKLLVVSGFVG